MASVIGLTLCILIFFSPFGFIQSDCDALLYTSRGQRLEFSHQNVFQSLKTGFSCGISSGSSLFAKIPVKEFQVLFV